MPPFDYSQYETPDPIGADVSSYEDVPQDPYASQATFDGMPASQFFGQAAQRQGQANRYATAEGVSRYQGRTLENPIIPNVKPYENVLMDESMPYEFRAKAYDRALNDRLKEMMFRPDGTVRDLSEAELEDYKDQAEYDMIAKYGAPPSPKTQFENIPGTNQMIVRSPDGKSQIIEKKGVDPNQAVPIIGPDGKPIPGKLRFGDKMIDIGPSEAEKTREAEGLAQDVEHIKEAEGLHVEIGGLLDQLLPAKKDDPAYEDKASKLQWASGGTRYLGTMPFWETPEKDTLAKINRLISVIGLENRQALKGSGAISDKEQKLLLDAGTQLSNPELSYDDRVKEIARLRVGLEEARAEVKEKRDALTSKGVRLPKQRGTGTEAPPPSEATGMTGTPTGTSGFTPMTYTRTGGLK